MKPAPENNKVTSVICTTRQRHCQSAEILLKEYNITANFP